MSKVETELDIVKLGREVLEAEANGLLEVSKRLDGNLERAVEIILSSGGKVVLTGMGKSGYIAQKIASTLCSTGTQAVFLHPAEAVHGDLGVYRAGDPTILISKSGTTAELMRLLPMFRQMESKVIAIVGNTGSPLAQKADVVLDGGVGKEADPLGVVPTTSTVVAMAIGDVLASVLMKLREFKESDFAKLHPAGQIGRNLLHTVGELMHGVGRIALVRRGDELLEVISLMTRYPQGAAVVVGEGNRMEGIITDGDVRRALLTRGGRIDGVSAEEVMIGNPTVAYGDMLASEALRLMEDRPKQISVLPVLGREGKEVIGLIRIHDIYQPH